MTAIFGRGRCAAFRMTRKISGLENAPPMIAVVPTVRSIPHLEFSAQRGAGCAPRSAIVLALFPCEERRIHERREDERDHEAGPQSDLICHARIATEVAVADRTQHRE